MALAPYIQYISWCENDLLIFVIYSFNTHKSLLIFYPCLRNIDFHSTTMGSDLCYIRPLSSHENKGMPWLFACLQSRSVHVISAVLDILNFLFLTQKCYMCSLSAVDLNCGDGTWLVDLCHKAAMPWVLEIQCSWPLLWRWPLIGWFAPLSRSVLNNASMLACQPSSPAYISPLRWTWEN